MAWPDLSARWPQLERLRWLALGIASGFVFVLVFARFSPLQPELYQYRDDGVITLSHAKNLVDYGSIGVDAAGARVEGFSAPLQFWVFVVAYAATHCDYARFLDRQVLLGTFFLGFVVVQLMRTRAWLALVLSALVAYSLSSCVRFYGWHHSGMENGFTHVLLVGTLACVAWSLETSSVRWPMLVCAWLASLSRTESIVHVAPLLAIWALAFHRQTRTWAALRGSAIVLAGWAGYQLFRYLYFGDLRPNTAVAEGIDTFAALKALLTGGSAPNGKILPVIGQIATEHRAALALVALPMLALGERNPRRFALALMLVSLGLTGLLHPALFGPARLDPVRTTSHVALVAPLLAATQWCELPQNVWRVVAAGVVAIAFTLYVRYEPRSSHYFCCPIARGTLISDTCVAYAKKQRVYRPSLANPDLGKISFRKELLIFDLGMLGSPPLAALSKNRKAMLSYLLDYAQPDFVEMHGAWSCAFADLQRDPRFSQRYGAVPGKMRLRYAGCGKAREGIWFRKALQRSSQDPERKLLDDLTRKLDTQRIAAELQSCRALGQRDSCVYVTRTVYRFIPELVQRGELDHVIALFRGSPSAPYDTGVLGAREHGTWYRGVAEFVRGGK
ncbi:MAG TPA: hypothetical protein VHM19_09515 [Polyangiales bacterium]|nr:hypothetical protein [Polyangiales bacterium]